MKTIEDTEKKYEQVSVMTVSKLNKRKTEVLSGRQADRLRIATEILVTSDQKYMNMVYPRTKPEEEPEEIVLRIQGFVIQSHLPPIVNRKQ